nr:hypothetical protein BaRGS_009490 [Batillaria attramentaria]
MINVKRRVDDIQYFAINGDGTESAEFLERKILALERLHVNQLVSEKCVALLEKTVRKVQATSDSPTQHAFLLVNTKLLALYSQLESPLMEFNRRQRELFQLLFLVPKSGTGDGGMEAGREVVSKMKVRLQQELMDYRDYLSVKAQRNITMTSYP